MLMLMGSEDNTTDHPELENNSMNDQPDSSPDKINSPASEQPADSSTSPESLNANTDQATTLVNDSPLKKIETLSPVNKPKLPLRPIIKGLILVIIILGLCVGAFFLGKHHEKVIVQAPPTQPINLPPQAIVLTNCMPGRGKQYIIPKDIPNGPIYDVQNSKVIAIEYNLNVQQLFTNSDTFSNAILSVVKNYPVNHLSIEPATTSTAQGSSAANQQGLSENIHLIMFIVSAADANSITCKAS